MQTQFENSNYGFEFLVIDSDSNVLLSEVCARSCNPSAKEATVGIAASGTHYILVRSTSSYGSPSGTYTFSATYSADTLSLIHI